MNLENYILTHRKFIVLFAVKYFNAKAIRLQISFKGVLKTKKVILIFTPVCGILEKDEA